jgi:hypothetical protein
VSISNDPQCGFRHLVLSRRFWRIDSKIYFAAVWQTGDLSMQVSEERNVLVDVCDKGRSGSATFGEDGGYTKANALR